MLLACPHCGHQGNLPDGADAPSMVMCPQCRNKFPTRPATLPGAGTILFCPSCGVQNEANNFRCVACGTVLHDVGPPAGFADDMTMGGLIPLKNVHALFSYYVAVFALIPCLGLFLGYTALGLGIAGLKYARRHPEAKGAVHAWVGILLGGFCGIVNTLLLIVPFVLAAMQRH